MNDSSYRYGLPYIHMGQAQKEIAHNEAVARIDTLLHLSVESRTVSAPPANPLLGEVWIVSVKAVDAWNGQSGAIASFDGFGWSFIFPREGCLAWVKDAAQFSVWCRGEWQPATQLRIPERITAAGKIYLPEAGIADPENNFFEDKQARIDISRLMSAMQKAGLMLD